jgi:hypothetical protein
MTGLLALQIAVYAFTLWLGLYLIARDRKKAVLVFTGLGLVAYALGLMLDTLTPYASDATWLESVRWPLRFAPALFWYSASASVLPEKQREALSRYTGRTAILVLVILYLLSLVFGVQKGSTVYWILAALVLLPLFLALGYVWRTYRLSHPRRPLAVLLSVTMFFTLSVGFFILPIDVFPPDWVLFSLGIDMVVLGGCIGFLDAFDEGETLLPDLLHSFTRSLLAVLIFGGQVLWALSWNSRITLPMLALLFTINQWCKLKSS